MVLTYAEVTVVSPKISPSGIKIGSELASGTVLSSSMTLGNSVRSANGRNSISRSMGPPSPVKYNYVIIQNIIQS